MEPCILVEDIVLGKRKRRTRCLTDDIDEMQDYISEPAPSKRIKNKKKTVNKSSSVMICPVSECAGFESQSVNEFDCHWLRFHVKKRKLFVCVACIALKEEQTFIHPKLLMEHLQEFHGCSCKDIQDDWVGITSETNTTFINPDLHKYRMSSAFYKVKGVRLESVTQDQANILLSNMKAFAKENCVQNNQDTLSQTTKTSEMLRNSTPTAILEEETLTVCGKLIESFYEDIETIESTDYSLVEFNENEFLSILDNLTYKVNEVEMETILNSEDYKKQFNEERNEIAQNIGTEKEQDGEKPVEMNIQIEKKCLAKKDLSIICEDEKIGSFEEMDIISQDETPMSEIAGLLTLTEEPTPDILVYLLKAKQTFSSLQSIINQSELSNIDSYVIANKKMNESFKKATAEIELLKKLNVQLVSEHQQNIREKEDLEKKLALQMEEILTYSMVREEKQLLNEQLEQALHENAQLKEIERRSGEIEIKLEKANNQLKDQYEKEVRIKEEVDKLFESRRQLTLEFRENDLKMQERIQKLTVEQKRYEIMLNDYDRIKCDIETARITIKRLENENQSLGQVTRERNSLRESLFCMTKKMEDSQIDNKKNKESSNIIMQKAEKCISYLGQQNKLLNKTVLEYELRINLYEGKIDSVIVKT